MKKHKRTASSLWRALNCPACFSKTTWIKDETYASRRGHRFHKMIEYYLKDKPFDFRFTYEDREDFNNWKEWWKRFKPLNVKEILGIEQCFGFNTKTLTFDLYVLEGERQYPDLEDVIFGTGDLIYKDFGNDIVYLDWKTGEYYTDYDVQFSFMSQAALEYYGGNNRKCCYYSTNNRKVKWLQQENIYDIREAIKHQLPEDTFRVGKWCSFCPASDCPKDSRFKVKF